MRKRLFVFIALVCCLVLAAGIFAACNSDESAQTGGQTPGGEGIEPARLIFEKTENGYSVTGYEGAPTVVVIPETYEGLPVTSIGAGAFYNCSGLTSVTIPDSVTSIGVDAFDGCSGLTSVIIPNSVTSIGEWAFGECFGLTSVIIGEGVTSIGDYAFRDCSSLASIIIPGSVTSMGMGAFAYCTGLTSVIIPDSVESIGASAFYGCDSLVSVYYTGDMASWCGIAGNDGFGSIMSSGRTLYIGGNKVEGEIIIPDGVTAIPHNAFAYQTGITSITIPDSVTSIGDYAFYNCSGLTSVTIPDSVTSIGVQAFSGCYGLTSVTFEGTVEEWNAIEKWYGWLESFCPVTEIVCSDGTVSVEKEQTY